MVLLHGETAYMTVEFTSYVDSIEKLFLYELIMHMRADLMYATLLFSPRQTIYTENGDN